MNLELLKDIDEEVQEVIDYGLEELEKYENMLKKKEEHEKKYGKSIRHYLDEIGRLGQVAAATGGANREGQGMSRAGEQDWVRGLSGQSTPQAKVIPNENDNVMYRDQMGTGMFVVTGRDNRYIYLGKEVGYDDRLRGHKQMPNQIKVPIHSVFKGGTKKGPAGGVVWALDVTR